MAFLRSVAATTTTTTAIVATALPAAFALASLSPSSSLPSSPSSQTSKTLTFSSLSSNSILRPDHLGLVKSFAAPPPAIHMDAPSSDHKLSFQNESALPELLTEYLVDMNCDGCVTAVKHKLQAVDGVKNVEVDLSSQVVRILGSSPVKTMTEALEQTGRKARLIGQGVPEEASKSRVPDKDLQSLTVERLRALLKEKGLPLKGKKDELIARLRGLNGSS